MIIVSIGEHYTYYFELILLKLILSMVYSNTMLTINSYCMSDINQSTAQYGLDPTL